MFVCMFDSPILVGSISFSLNGTGLGRPIIPGAAPECKLNRARVVLPPLPRGPFGHHLLWLVNQFWLRDDNRVLPVISNYIDPAFNDILTQIAPKPRETLFRPLTLAKGFSAVASQNFWAENWEPMHLEWICSDIHVGTTETGRRPRPPSAIALGVNSTSSLSQNASTNQPPTRIVFSGTPMPAARQMLLIREVMTRFWQFGATRPVHDLAVHRTDIFAEDDDPSGPWALRFSFDSLLRPGSARDPVLFADITDRFLQMLRLPAHVDRWETLDAAFYIGSGKIASINIYKVTASGNQVGAASGLPSLGSAGEQVGIS